MKRNDLLKTICLIVLIVGLTVGSALALNLVTGPRIEAKKKEREELAAQQAAGVLLQVLPGATKLEDITATLTIDPSSGVSAVHKEVNGKGFVFIASKTNAPMTDLVNVTIGVNPEGKIAGIHTSFNNPKDYFMDTYESFIGLDSTVSGFVVDTGATVSSNTIKEAIVSGFTVLAANNLMKAAEKTTEQVFEELLPTVFKGFVKGSDLTVSGNITVAYKAVNGSGLVCYVTSGEQTLLATVNASGTVALYKANCLDENTQQYELINVTSENADVASEVSTFAASHLSTTFVALETKVKELFGDEAVITELSVKTAGVVTSAATVVVGEATYYAYLAKPVNGYEGDIMSVYVVLDNEGKIYHTSAKQYKFGEYVGNYPPLSNFDGDKFYAGLANKNESSYNVGDFTITGATFTTQAMDLAVKGAFAEFNQGGSN